MGNCLFQLASTLIFISVIQPYFLCGAVPLMVVYYFIQKVRPSGLSVPGFGKPVRAQPLICVGTHTNVCGLMPGALSHERV